MICVAVPFGIVLAIVQNFSRCQHNLVCRNERCFVSFGSEIVSRLTNCELQIAIQHFVVRAATPNIIHQANSAGKNRIKIHYAIFVQPLRTEQLAKYLKHTILYRQNIRAKPHQIRTTRFPSRHIINYILLKTLQLR